MRPKVQLTEAETREVREEVEKAIGQIVAGIRERKIVRVEFSRSLSCENHWTIVSVEYCPGRLVQVNAFRGPDSVMAYDVDDKEKLRRILLKDRLRAATRFKAKMLKHDRIASANDERMKVWR